MPAAFVKRRDQDRSVLAMVPIIDRPPELVYPQRAPDPPRRSEAMVQMAPWGHTPIRPQIPVNIYLNPVRNSSGCFRPVKVRYGPQAATPRGNQLPWRERVPNDAPIAQAYTNLVDRVRGNVKGK